jgi:hypothetical protein
VEHAQVDGVSAALYALDMASRPTDMGHNFVSRLLFGILMDWTGTDA